MIALPCILYDTKQSEDIRSDPGQIDQVEDLSKQNGPKNVF